MPLCTAFNRYVSYRTTANIKLPISQLLSTQHSGIQVNNEIEAWLWMFMDKTLLITNDTKSQMNYGFSVYISDMYFGYDTPTGTATTGDVYTYMNTSNFSVNNGSLSTDTIAGKSGVKLTYAAGWVNLSVRSGKTFRDLDNYTKLKIELYIEGSNMLYLYYQGVYGLNTTIKYYSYICHDDGVIYGAEDNAPNGFYKLPTNKWITLELPIEQVRQRWYNTDTTGYNSFMIVRWQAQFTALYFASMTFE